MISTHRKDFPWKKWTKFARFWKKKNLSIARFSLLVPVGSKKYIKVFIFSYFHLSTCGQIWLNHFPDDSHLGYITKLEKETLVNPLLPTCNWDHPHQCTWKCRVLHTLLWSKPHTTMLAWSADHQTALRESLATKIEKKWIFKKKNWKANGQNPRMQRSNRKHHRQRATPTPATTHSQNEEYFNFYHPCLLKNQGKKKKKKKSQTWCLRGYKFFLLPSVKEHY